MTGRAERWLPAAAAPGSGSRLRLFCLPYAGGGASVYSSWARALPEVTVMPVHLPGREGRLAEQPYDQMAPLVAELAGVLAAKLDRPYALFGHSMGGLVAFELARRMRDEQQPSPAALLVSACRAPHRRVPQPAVLDPVQILRRAKQLGGTPSEVFRHPQLVRLVLPALRADFALVDSYAYRPGPPLRLPTTVIYGRDDPDLSADEAGAWRQLTTGPARIVCVPGGHFSLTEHPEAVLTAVRSALRDVLSLTG